MTADDLDYHVWPPLSERGCQQVGRYVGILVVHRETGWAVVCESERSRHGNREKATARLLEMLTAPDLDALAALKEALECATHPLPPELASREDMDERNARISALWRRWFGREIDDE